MAGVMIKEMRDFPSVEELLQSKELSDALARIPKPVGAEMVKSAMAAAKKKFQSPGKPLSKKSLIVTIRRHIEQHIRRRLKRVINGTGTIIHTNLGRAPLSETFLNTINETVSGYSNLEFDLQTGRRGQRGEVCEKYLAQLAGAESATVVNNCAAALFIIVNSLANRKRVIISRGELVQIGGGFRIQDILKRAGAKLCEIGSSNITTTSDYEQALNDSAAMILKVHKSNFAQFGFTSEIDIKELASLPNKKETLIVNDLGSGSFLSTRALLGYDEPTVQQSVRAGADLTCFSGDKLLGGMQAGLIVGRADLISKIKKNPLFRTLRVDKILFATLERLLVCYLDGNEAKEIPLWRLLSVAESELYKRGKALLKKLGNPPELSVIGCSAFVGGGAAPEATIPSVAIRFSQDLSANKLSKSFRECQTPIIGRIKDDSFMIDLRAIEVTDLDLVRESIARVLLDLGGSSKI